MESGISIALNRVRKEYENGTKALADIELQIAAGDFVAILGPSGCGKTTLLKIIAGLERPSNGEARMAFEGDRRAGVAYVFQDAHLLPWRTVVENVALPLELIGDARGQRLAAARKALADVGLTEFEQAYPEQLSGGMRMRVSIARALITRPKLLLMDEPFAALDEITRQNLDDQLRELWLRERMTLLFITHSISEATHLSNRMILLSPRPGRVILDCAVPLPEKRAGVLRTSADFIKHSQKIYEALHGASA